MSQLRAKHGWRRWGEEALLSCFKWAGHVARITAWAPERLVGKALRYRGAQYLADMKVLTGTQGHPERFHVWRWELLFSKHWGPNWSNLALNGEQWGDLSQDLLKNTLKRLKDY